MNASALINESILNQLPGLILVKEIKKNKSHYVWCNDRQARLVGFKNSDAAIGIADEEIKCDAADNAETFYQHDREVMAGSYLQTLDIYNYKSDGICCVIGVKKYLLDEFNQPCAILFSGQEIKKSDVPKLNRNLADIINSVYMKTHETVCFTDKYEALGLTKRESECFYYILRGKSSREIANILNITSRTVEHYQANIKSKTNTHSKSQLFDIAIAKGLLNIIPAGLVVLGRTIVL